MTALDFKPVQNDEISGEEKLRLVTKLVRELRADLKEVNYLPQERNAAMEQLKIFVRDPNNAGPIYTPEGIEILIQHSFHTPSPTTSRAALQALANALLSGPQTRQMFVDSGYSPRAVARLKNPKKDDEFLLSRILFFTTYGTTQPFQTLIEKHHLAEHINDNIARHAKAHAKLAGKPPSVQEDNVLTESLKLLFNITHHYKSHTDRFHKSIGSIIKIISFRNVNQDAPVTAPMNHLVNGLLNLSLDEKKAFPSKSELRTAVDKLAQVLDHSLSIYTAEEELESALVPLLTLLKLISRAAPQEVRLHLKKLLLPLSDQVYEQRTNPGLLSHKLLAHMHAPISTRLHDTINSLFFELSDHDTEQLGSTFGISFASGFILTRNNQMPLNPSYESSVRSSLLSSPISLLSPGSRSSTSSQALLVPGPSSSPSISPVMEVFPRLQPVDSAPAALSTKTSSPKRPEGFSMNRTMSAPVVATATNPSKPRSQSASQAQTQPRAQAPPMKRSESQLAVEQATANLGALLASRSSTSMPTQTHPIELQPPINLSTRTESPKRQLPPSLQISIPTSIKPLSQPPTKPLPIPNPQSIATTKPSQLQVSRPPMTRTNSTGVSQATLQPSRPALPVAMTRSITAPAGKFKTREFFFGSKSTNSNSTNASSGTTGSSGFFGRSTKVGKVAETQQQKDVLFGAVDIDVAIARKIGEQTKVVIDADLESFDSWF